MPGNARRDDRRAVIAIRDGGLDHPAVQSLLRLHLAGSHAETPAANAHALDLDGLRAAGIAFVTAWDDDTLLGMGALKQLDDGTGEIKSMRTAPGQLRRGVARAILFYLVGVARARDYPRLYLETGTAPLFAPANALYEAFGFVDGPVFGGYPPSPHNRFMTLPLT
jgi:putative acetyltransferase